MVPSSHRPKGRKQYRISTILFIHAFPNDPIPYALNRSFICLPIPSFRSNHQQASDSRHQAGQRHPASYSHVLSECCIYRFKALDLGLRLQDFGLRDHKNTIQESWFFKTMSLVQPVLTKETPNFPTVLLLGPRSCGVEQRQNIQHAKGKGEACAYSPASKHEWRAGLDKKR